MAAVFILVFSFSHSVSGLSTGCLSTSMCLFGPPALCDVGDSGRGRSPTVIKLLGLYVTRSRVEVRNVLGFLRLGNYPSRIPKAVRTPLIGCPRLLILYIRSYSSFVGAISSICSMRTRRAVVTRDARKSLLH
jgi:hypothetical protein